MRLCSLAASRCSSLYGGADFLRSIIPSRRIFFNPASSAPAHKSCSALRSPGAPAGLVRRPPVPARPACRSAYCAPAPRPAPQREIGGVQFWVWESRGLSAAPWWVVFSFPLPAGQSVQGRGLTDVGLFALLFSGRACFWCLVQAWKYSQYLQYISSALDRKTKPARGTYPGSKHCFDIAFSSAVNK